MQWVNDDCWSVERDEELVKVVNAQCDQRGCDPANLQLTPADSQFSEMLQDPEQMGRVRARFCVLLALNRRLEKLLPLVDLSATQAGGFVPTGDPRRIRFSSSLGRRVAALRGLCFMRTKLELWNTVIRDTALYTQPEQENMTKASEVPNITVDTVTYPVDRLVMLKSYKERLERSVFGQLIGQSYQWSDAGWRRNYSYSEDGGQQRNFFVKFANQKAVDQGGPYRAVLEKAAGTEAAGPLRLLVPSRKDIEQKRGQHNAEYFVFNSFPDTDKGQHGPGGDSALEAEESLRAAVQLELDRERAAKMSASKGSGSAAAAAADASALGRLSDGAQAPGYGDGVFTTSGGEHTRWHDGEYFFLGRLVGACIRH